MLNKLCHHTAALFTEHSEWLCPHTKTRRGQTVQWQHLHQIAKSLSQLYRPTSGIEGQNLGIVNATPRTLLRLVHMVFSAASCNIRTSAKRRKIVQSYVRLRAACTMSNHTCCEKCHHSEGMSDLGTSQSHFKTCHYFVICPSVKLKESIS